MAFQAKQDYCGLTALTNLGAAIAMRDDALNAATETYQPQGQDGSFVALEVFGEDAAPTNAYALKSDVAVPAGELKLNAVTTVDGKCYALESVEITTGAAAAVAISATAQRVENGATTEANCTYPIETFALTTKHHAQILFGAFTLSGDGCTLTACNATIGGSINKDKVAGNIIGSDINSGAITVTATILQTGETAPTITPAAGWTLTSPISPTNPETEYKNYEITLVKNLVKGSAA